MRKENTVAKLVIMPEHYREMNIQELLEKDDVEKSDSPLQYPLYFECIQSALISFFKNHEKLASERKKTEEHIFDFKSPDNVNNIIAFLGKRGSGKTTAINEFGRILTCIEEEKVYQWWKKHLKSSIEEKEIEKFQFVVLDSIDASLLTASEDIVELVLAQMYAKIDNKFQNNRRNSECYNIADTLDCFRTAYRNYHNLNRGVPEKELGDSVPNILKNIPSGSNVRKAFKVLLDHFFLHMELDDQRPRYLVITIDDLDLNIDYGYQLLEKIRKYLSDPRILVLITADFNQLSRVCEVYWLNQYGQDDTVRVYCDNRQYYGTGRFYGNTQVIKRYNDSEDYESSEYHESAIRLSRDYLLKAIPITHRVYLSGTKDMQKVYIHENEKIIPLKKYIWKKLVKKLGIYYDLTGTKRHFVMPTTVREFVTYNNFLDSLYSFAWEKRPEGESEKEKFFRENMSKYDWNHYRMNKDITTRMVHSLLTPPQKDEFDRLIDKNILNRAKYAVNFFENWQKKEAKDKTDEMVYRYGDLLEGIYKLGREDYHDKELVHCIMAYFTSEMTREYYGSLFLEGQEKADAKNNLRHFLGTSFGNEWLGEILPAIHIGRKKGIIAGCGFVEKAQLGTWFLEGKIKKKERTWSAELINRKLCESLEDNKFMEIFGLFMMLFTRLKKKRMTVIIPKIELKFKNKAKKEEAENDAQIGIEEEEWVPKSADEKVNINLQENELAYELSLAVDTADFDVLGFIGKTWEESEIEKFAENFTQDIIDEVQRVTGEKSRTKQNGNEKNNDKMKNTIYKQLKEIMGDNEMIFPFYNLDLSYNVLKHARGMSMEREGIIEAGNIYEAMQKVYGYIAMKLYEEDRQYDQYGIARHEMTLNPEKNEKWSMRFVNSPFVARFGILYPKVIFERLEEDRQKKIQVKLDEEIEKGLQKEIWKAREEDKSEEEIREEVRKKIEKTCKERIIREVDEENEYRFIETGETKNKNYVNALIRLVTSIRVPDIEDAPDDNEDEKAW